MANREEQIAHALDLKSRLEEVLQSVEDAPRELDGLTVAMMVRSVLNKYNDAKFENSCRQADTQA